MRNKYRIDGDTVYILLERRNKSPLETMVDLDDLEKLLSYDVKWFAGFYKNINGYYAQASEYLGCHDGKGEYKSVKLHRFLINVTNRYEVVDHENHNTLDNRRKQNLKIGTYQKNSINRKGANKKSTTGHRNVSYSKANNEYLVQFQVNKRNKCFGRFDELDDAVVCANRVRKEIYGIFDEA